MTKVFNFSPGPSKLPQVVINKVEKAVKEFKKTGKSVLEISHRSPEFDELLNEINLNFERIKSMAIYISKVVEETKQELEEQLDATKEP